MDNTPENTHETNPGIPKKPDDVIIEPMRTFAQDVRNAVETQNISVVKMALAEKERRGDQPDADAEAAARKKKNVLIASVSAGLVLVGIAAVGGIYFYLSYSKNALLTQEANSSFISSDSNHTIVINGETKVELEQKINLEENSLGNGLVERIYFHLQNTPATNTLSTSDFLNILQTKAPGSLTRSLSADFAFGFYGKGRVPFIILSTNSYDQAYAGMLQWEPFMREEFENILYSTDFENQLPVSTSTVALSATTSTSTKTTALATSTSTASTSVTVAPAPAPIAFPSSFNDLIVGNKDTRVLYNRNGDILVLYGFVDKHYIVITRDPDALNDIYNQLRENELSR